MNAAGCLAAGSEKQGQSQTADLDNDANLVRWTGRRAVVTLPAHIDLSDAGRIREALLSAINRRPVELIVDMSATQSCDYAGHDAVARAYQYAVASGTQLRLVITADIVRRGFRLSGLDQLVPVYPTLHAATAASMPATLADRSRKGKEHAIGVEPPQCEGNAAPPTAAGQANFCQDVLDKTVHSLFSVGLSLHAATGEPPPTAGPHIAQALQLLDDAIRDIRNHLLGAPTDPAADLRAFFGRLK